jgi:undecaprenyl-diphosphatase
VILGLIQGPTELMPVSSSAHLAMIPQIAGWDRSDLDPELLKSFEVALHAGTAMAMVLVRRKELREGVDALDLRRLTVIALSFLPPAVIGYLLEDEIETRLGGAGTTAAGLVVGAVLMALADLAPQRRGEGEAGAIDGLALGFAQAAALIPGVSRNGATLTAARSRGFTREHSNLLSRTVALPVIGGASLLKATRLAKRGIDRRQMRWLGLGLATSFLSTVAFSRVIDQVERDRPLWPWSAYRIAFAALVIARLRPTANRRSNVVESVPMESRSNPASHSRRQSGETNR